MTWAIGKCSAVPRILGQRTHSIVSQKCPWFLTRCLGDNTGGAAVMIPVHLSLSCRVLGLPPAPTRTHVADTWHGDLTWCLCELREGPPTPAGQRHAQCTAWRGNRPFSGSCPCQGSLVTHSEQGRAGGLASPSVHSDTGQGYYAACLIFGGFSQEKFKRKKARFEIHFLFYWLSRYSI